MGTKVFLLSAAAAIFIVYCILAQIKYNRKTNSLGCQSAPLYRPWDVLGVQNFRLELNGMRTNRLSDSFVIRKKAMSESLGRECKTFRIRYPPGETWYYTFDPRNLQAVLATQFKDFQQPTSRIGAFQPLLGSGIVSFAP